MKKKLLILHILFLVSYCSFSQGVGIGTTTPDASAALDITASGKGLLIPRMNTAAINHITNPANGLMVYDSTVNQLLVNTGTPVTPNWQPVANTTKLTAPVSATWNLGGNSGTNPATQFLGTTDNQPLRFRVNNIQTGELQPATGNISWGLRAGQGNTIGFSNIAIGTDALKLNTSSANLVAIGDSALFNNGRGSSLSDQAVFNTAIGSKALFSNTTGVKNTATGFNSLFFNTTGGFNTATGFGSLGLNTTGSNNTGVGSESLFSNTTGVDNTAIGFRSLISNTTGINNTGIGSAALFSNTTGFNNTSVGFQSLRNNSAGIGNTALGQQSLSSNISGNDNTAVGSLSLSLNTFGTENTATGTQSLQSNRTGLSNTAVGVRSLRFNIGGSDNTAIGLEAMRNNSSGNFNVAIGNFALDETTGSQNNTVIGYLAGSTVDLGFNNTFIGAQAEANSTGTFNSVVIGNQARATASNQVRLGNTFTTSIGGFVGFTNLSDGRYKKNIQETVKGIDFIMKLRPVMYQFDMERLDQKLYPGKKMDELSAKSAKESGKTVFSGFVAQEVEQAARDAGYDFSGVDKPKNENDFYGLRYADFVVPLVKAMQEQQLMITELKKQNSDLQKRVLALEKK